MTVDHTIGARHATAGHKVESRHKAGSQKIVADAFQQEFHVVINCDILIYFHVRFSNFSGWNCPLL